jgi:4-hydroxy-tetrahydrodipicolinate reductase
MIRVAVAGAAGRMGRAIIRAIAEGDDMTLAGALVSASSSNIGRDAGEVAGCTRTDVLLSADAAAALSDADVLIDFSRADASVELARHAAKAGVPDVIGTTGFTAEQDATIAAAARDIPIVKSGNMSLGIAVLSALVKQAAKALPDFDVEIVEMHHRMKRDAPSGTALLLGEAAAQARNVSLSQNAVRGRSGDTGPRQEGTIGFASLRGGTVAGEHAVIFAGAHERLQLSHIAEDRSIFANGALTAARWTHGKTPGLYGMNDVLGLAADRRKA